MIYFIERLDTISFGEDKFSIFIAMSGHSEREFGPLGTATFVQFTQTLLTTFIEDSEMLLLLGVYESPSSMSFIEICQTNNTDIKVT